MLLTTLKYDWSQRQKWCGCNTEDMFSWFMVIAVLMSCRKILTFKKKSFTIFCTRDAKCIDIILFLWYEIIYHLFLDVVISLYNVSVVKAPTVSLYELWQYRYWGICVKNVVIWFCHAVLAFYEVLFRKYPNIDIYTVCRDIAWKIQQGYFKASFPSRVLYVHNIHQSLWKTSNT